MNILFLSYLLLGRQSQFSTNLKIDLNNFDFIQALKAGIKTDQDCVKAFIASVSNRMYTADKSKDHTLMCR